MMLKNMTNKERAKPLRGREVIEEAARFLRQMRFWANRGAYAEGQHVAVSVDSRWNDDHQTIQTLITCYAFGHRRVDWEGVPVFVLPEREGKKEGWMLRLNARGQVVFPSLPPEDYHLSTSTQYGVESVPLRLRAVGAPQPKEAELPEIYSYESIDGHVRATVYQTKEDKTVVVFETENEALADATVHFAFVQKAGKVEQSAEVKLEPTRVGLWEGRWENFIKLSEPCDLVFEVLAGDE